MRDTRNSFGATSIAFHWAIAVIVLISLAAGFSFDYLPEDLRWSLMPTHKSIGLIVVMLAMLRIVWRLANGMPTPGGATSKWQHILARTVQFVLLVGTIVLPVSGIMMTLAGGRSLAVFGWELVAAQRGTPGFVANESLGNLAWTLHGVGALLLLLAILLHVAGAWKHHFIDRDRTLDRMLGRAAMPTVVSGKAER